MSEMESVGWKVPEVQNKNRNCCSGRLPRVALRSPRPTYMYTMSRVPAVVLSRRTQHIGSPANIDIPTARCQRMALPQPNLDEVSLCRYLARSSFSVCPFPHFVGLHCQCTVVTLCLYISIMYASQVGNDSRYSGSDSTHDHASIHRPLPMDFYSFGDRENDRKVGMIHTVTPLLLLSPPAQ